MLQHKATYWAPGENDGFGDIGYIAPVLIACRWEGKQRLARDKDGVEFVTQALVYTSGTLLVSGYVALGDLTDCADPKDDTGAMEIRLALVSPSIDGECSLCEVTL